MTGVQTCALPIYEKMKQWFDRASAKEPEEWSVGSDGGFRCSNRLCVPDVEDLRKDILDEAHKSRLTVHPGGTKMYKDLKRNFWWEGMKRHVAEHVSKFLTCQQVKTEYQKPAGLLQSLPIPQWKWEHISIDFMVRLLRSQQNHDAIWVIVERLTKLAHFIAYNMTYTVEKMSQNYIQQIIRLHGVPITIVSDHHSRVDMGPFPPASTSPSLRGE